MSINSLSTLVLESIPTNKFIEALGVEGCPNISLIKQLKEAIFSQSSHQEIEGMRWAVENLTGEFEYIRNAYNRIQENLPEGERTAVSFDTILGYKNAQIEIEYNNYSKFAQEVITQIGNNAQGLQDILNDGNLNKEQKTEAIKEWFKSEENRNSIRNIQRLNLDRGNLTKIPEEIGNLANLRSLHLSQNQIREIPTEIGNLGNLRSLYLHNNQIRAIPPAIGNLANLRELDLSRNQIREISTEIRKLANSIALYLN